MPDFIAPSVCNPMKLLSAFLQFTSANPVARSFKALALVMLLFGLNGAPPYSANL